MQCHANSQKTKEPQLQTLTKTCLEVTTKRSTRDDLQS